MAIRGVISYWWLPIISSAVWLSTLLGMLLWWLIDHHSRHLPSQEPYMSLPYISDIGAFQLKPLFIAGSAVTTVTFDLSFAAERWLRHKGRLVPNGSRGEKILVSLTIVFAIIGTFGLILLSIFDTYHHNTLHNLFLLLFIAGYLISAIFVCWEYQRLGIKNRGHRVLRASFWIKLTFVIVEVILAIAFASLTFTHHKNVAAYIEWIIAFIFTFYVLSFVIDLWPARVTKRPSQRFGKPTPSSSSPSTPPPGDVEMGVVGGGNGEGMNGEWRQPNAVQQQPQTHNAGLTTNF